MNREMKDRRTDVVNETIVDRIKCVEDEMNNVGTSAIVLEQCINQTHTYDHEEFIVRLIFYRINRLCRPRYNLMIPSPAAYESQAQQLPFPSAPRR